MSNTNQNQPAATQPETFGVYMWWTVPRLTVPVATAQALLLKHGFEEKDMKEPSDRAEVKRAVDSFQNRRTKQDRKLAEIACENGDAVVYGILEKEQKGDNVDFVQRTTVTYDKNANTVNVTGALVDAVQQALAGYKDVMTDDDVRIFLRNIVKMCKGISQRQSGGIYFVPSQFVSIVEQANAFLTELSTGARLYMARVMNGVPERQIVWEAAEEELDGKLDELLANVERIERRVSSLRKGEEKVEELRGMMKVYQDLLGTEAKYEEMAQKMDAAVQTIAAKIGKLQGMDMQPELPVAANPTDDFDAAVKSVLSAAGKPMEIEAIVAQAKANGFTGKVPVSINGFFNYRVNNGELVRVSRGQYTMPVAKAS
jgi:hypothetical protein